MATVGIFPASGKLGGSTTRHLLKLVPHDRVILVCRHPEKVPADYTKSGVRVRQASYEDSPAELEAAFAGIDVLFLISYPSHVHEYRAKVQLPAVDAARRAGVKHLLYSSLAYAGSPDSHESRAVVMQAHLDTERHLRELAASSALQQTPFRFTAIREGLYAESVPIYTAFFSREKDSSGEIRIPHDGSAPGIAWAHIDDLGEATARLVAAAALGDEAAQGNPALAAAAKYLAKSDTILLSGPRAWTLAETVDAAFNKDAGQSPVKIRQVSVDDYTKEPAVQAVFGSPEKARTWATAWDAVQHGETAAVSPALADILGREPTPAF